MVIVVAFILPIMVKEVLLSIGMSEGAAMKPSTRTSSRYSEAQALIVTSTMLPARSASLELWVEMFFPLNATSLMCTGRVPMARAFETVSKSAARARTQSRKVFFMVVSCKVFAERMWEGKEGFLFINLFVFITLAL